MNLTSTSAGSFSGPPTAFIEAADNITVAKGPIAPEQIDLVRTTWTHVAPIAEQAASLFYNRLFELDPAIKPMFASSNLKVEKRKLMQTIGIAVKHLHRFDEIVPMVHDLGKRHAGYGVQQCHYDTVGEALLWALEEGLGELFTHQVRDAWAATYSILADTMKDAAAEELDG